MGQRLNTAQPSLIPGWPSLLHSCLNPPGNLFKSAYNSNQSCSHVFIFRVNRSRKAKDSSKKFVNFAFLDYSIACYIAPNSFLCQKLRTLGFRKSLLGRPSTYFTNRNSCAELDSGTSKQLIKTNALVFSHIPLPCRLAIYLSINHFLLLLNLSYRYCWHLSGNI